LEVHANTLGLSDAKTGVDGIAATVSSISTMLRAFLLIADNKERVVSAVEVLSTLGIQHGLGA
jgi:hypothetical protein